MDDEPHPTGSAENAVAGDGISSHHEFARLAVIAGTVVANRVEGEDIAREALARASRGGGEASAVAIDLALGRTQRLAGAIRSRLRLGPSAFEATQTRRGDPALWAAIDRLPARRRAVVALHYLEGKPVADMAEILRIPVSEATSDLHQTRSDLTKTLGQVDDRVRATLEAEVADIERRADASRERPRFRSLRWKLLAAAVLVVIALGTVLVVARSRDGDTDLDAAVAQPTSAPDVAAVQTPSPTTSTGCERPVEAGLAFVWGIEVDDPDGGLVAHDSPGVDAPVTRLLEADAIVTLTGNCALADNGASWYELSNDGIDRDWVNGQYLRTPQPACLSGEQYGTRFRDGEPFFHTLIEGDRLGGLAAVYNVSLADIISANPGLDPSALRIGRRLRIPGVRGEPEQIFGPLDGLGITDGDRAAFGPNGSVSYRWYPAAAISTSDCLGHGPVEPACLNGQIRLIDPRDPEPMWTGDGPVSGLRTGRVLPPEQPGGQTLVELQISEGAELVTGFVDPGQLELTDGPCVLVGPDDLTSVPCRRGPFSDFALEGATLTARESTDPMIDHVHDLRTQSNDECTRVVVEYGQNLMVDDSAAADLPEVRVRRTDTSLSIVVPGDAVQTAFQHPQRISFPSGEALLSVSFDFEYSVELVHAPHEAHVRFLDDPARVVVDLFPLDPKPGILDGPFGEEFVIREPIQRELNGAGISPEIAVVVEGFGRPFEAHGLYRIWSVADDVDVDVFLSDPPPADLEGPLITSAWAEGWGTFSVELPILPSGTYLALFGEVPPLEELGFRGAGQLFRVAEDPPTPSATGTFPPAVLLPDVELPPGAA